MRGISLLPQSIQRIIKSLLCLGELLELRLIEQNIWHWFQRDIIEEIEDVARQNDGEHQKGGSPFASGKVESCFHSAKIISRTGGCQEVLHVFFQQAKVDKLVVRQQAVTGKDFESLFDPCFAS